MHDQHTICDDDIIISSERFNYLQKQYTWVRKLFSSNLQWNEMKCLQLSIPYWMKIELLIQTMIMKKRITHTYNSETANVILTCPSEDEESHIREIGKFHSWGRLTLLHFIGWKSQKMAIALLWHDVNILSKTESNSS